MVLIILKICQFPKMSNKTQIMKFLHFDFKESLKKDYFDESSNVFL